MNLSLIVAHLTAAAALHREEEERAAKRLALLEHEQRSWYESISEREEVLTAILVCLITSLILIVFIATGNSALVCSIVSSYHVLYNSTPLASV